MQRPKYHRDSNSWSVFDLNTATMTVNSISFRIGMVKYLKNVNHVENKGKQKKFQYMKYVYENITSAVEFVKIVYYIWSMNSEMPLFAFVCVSFLQKRKKIQCVCK